MCSCHLQWSNFPWLPCFFRSNFDVICCQILKIQKYLDSQNAQLRIFILFSAYWREVLQEVLLLCQIFWHQGFIKDFGIITSVRLPSWSIKFIPFVLCMHELYTVWFSLALQSTVWHAHEMITQKECTSKKILVCMDMNWKKTTTRASLK